MRSGAYGTNYSEKACGKRASRSDGSVLRNGIPPRVQQFVLAALLLCGAFGLKWWYRTTSVDELAFLLKPVAGIIGLLSGEEWHWVGGTGALFPGAHVLIDRSCSGINFLVITAATFAFLLLKRPDAGCSRPLLAVLSVGGAIALTVLANSGRILAMLWLQRAGIHLAPTAHEAVGAFFFLAALLLASLALDRWLQPRAARSSYERTT